MRRGSQASPSVRGTSIPNALSICFLLSTGCPPTQARILAIGPPFRPACASPAHCRVRGSRKHRVLRGVVIETLASSHRNTLHLLSEEVGVRCLPTRSEERRV